MQEFDLEFKAVSVRREAIMPLVFTHMDPKTKKEARRWWCFFNPSTALSHTRYREVEDLFAEWAAEKELRYFIGKYKEEDTEDSVIVKHDDETIGKITPTKKLSGSLDAKGLMNVLQKAEDLTAKVVESEDSSSVTLW